MAKFPRDAPEPRVVKSPESLGFRLIREQEHISMVRDNEDGTRRPLTMANRGRIKISTLRTPCTQANVPRDEFLRAYRET
jgi:hypothetical protein